MALCHFSLSSETFLFLRNGVKLMKSVSYNGNHYRGSFRGVLSGLANGYQLWLRKFIKPAIRVSTNSQLLLNLPLLHLLNILIPFSTTMHPNYDIIATLVVPPNTVKSAFFYVIVLDNTILGCIRYYTGRYHHA